MNTTPGVLTQNHVQLKLNKTPKNAWKIVGQANYMVVITAIFDGFERRKSPFCVAQILWREKATIRPRFECCVLCVEALSPQKLLFLLKDLVKITFSSKAMRAFLRTLGIY